MRVAVGLGTFAALVLVGSVTGCLRYYPEYNVYSQRMEGEAQYAKAENTRRTRVLEAQAANDAAALTAEAEVKRAEGVARANKILAESLGGPEGYLRWKYIEMLEETGRTEKSRDVIYIPTEGALPLLEAGRRAPPATIAPK